ncbi:MAG: hypothetical protein ACRYGR_08270 [Janthinobacterium lividum]
MDYEMPVWWATATKDERFKFMIRLISTLATVSGRRSALCKKMGKHETYFTNRVQQDSAEFKDFELHIFAVYTGLKIDYLRQLNGTAAPAAG